MRDIAQLPNGIPKQVDSNFPFGAIINETDSVFGTPVVREIYNDVLVNLYKLLAITGSPANGIEDSEATTYQLLAAFQKLCNVQNDIEQQLSINGAVASINLAIDLLPNKYFLFAKASGDYASTVTTFKGSGSLTYPLVSAGFKANDELLLILNQTGVVAYSLTVATAVSNQELFPVFGNPLAFNNSNTLWYESQGVLFNDNPESYDLQAAIRVATGTSTFIVYETLIIGAYVLCLGYNPANNLYRFYRFTLSNLNAAPTTVTMNGLSFPGAIGYDDQPFVFTDGTKLYITNGADSSTDDFDIASYTLNLAAGEMTNIGTTNINSGYKKSTNTVIVGNYLYTFINGAIEQYNLNTGAYTFGKNFPGYIGLMFNYKGNVYYSNGGVAKKWALPGY